MITFNIIIHARPDYHTLPKHAWLAKVIKKNHGSVDWCVGQNTFTINLPATENNIEDVRLMCYYNGLSVVE